MCCNSMHADWVLRCTSWPRSWVQYSNTRKMLHDTLTSAHSMAATGAGRSMHAERVRLRKRLHLNGALGHAYLD